jgi:peptide/nickel transport system permease protein
VSIASSTLPTATTPEIRQPRAYVEFCRQQPLGTISFAIICAMMIAGIFCEWVAPYDPLAIDFASLLMAPSSDHWCGTDAFGRDICSRLIYGSRTALVIGFTSSFFGSSIGAILGIASAYFGGRIATGSSAWSTYCWRFRSSYSPSSWWRRSASSFWWAST